MRLHHLRLLNYVTISVISAIVITAQFNQHVCYHDLYYTAYNPQSVSSVIIYSFMNVSFIKIVFHVIIFHVDLDFVVRYVH